MLSLSLMKILVSVALLHAGAGGAPPPQVLQPQAISSCPARAGKIRLVGQASPSAIGRGGALKAILLCRYHGSPYFGRGAPEGGPRHVGDLIDARVLSQGPELQGLAKQIEALRHARFGRAGGTVTCIGDLGQKIYMRFVFDGLPPVTAMALPTGCIRVVFGAKRLQYAFTRPLLRDLEGLLPPKKAPPES
jgi:hypothetical protein